MCEKLKYWTVISESEYFKKAGNPDKPRRNAWRVWHKKLNKAATTCGPLATVSKKTALHWAEQFEKVAPSGDLVEIDFTVRDSGLVKSFSSWMIFEHTGGGKKEFPEFWPEKPVEEVPALTLRAHIDKKGNVILCHPVNGGIVATFPADYTNKPKKGDKTAMVNCSNRPLIWHNRPVAIAIF